MADNLMVMVGYRIHDDTGKNFSIKDKTDKNNTAMMHAFYSYCKN